MIHAALFRYVTARFRYVISLPTWISHLTNRQILLYSFYHNDTARITQMCWNGEQKPITFRQSRLVDISSKSLDTPDVSILLRWMDCIALRKPKMLPRRGAARAGGTTL